MHIIYSVRKGFSNKILKAVIEVIKNTVKALDKNK